MPYWAALAASAESGHQSGQSTGSSMDGGPGAPLPHRHQGGLRKQRVGEPQHGRSGEGAGGRAEGSVGTPRSTSGSSGVSAMESSAEGPDGTLAWQSSEGYPSLLPPDVWMRISSAQFANGSSTVDGGRETGQDSRNRKIEAGPRSRLDIKSTAGHSTDSLSAYPDSSPANRDFMWRGLDAIHVSDPAVLVPGGGAQECVVLHVTGASRESRSVLGMLRHVVSAASSFFELGFEPAWDERRLAS